MIYLFDACALIAHLSREEGEGFEEVKALLVTKDGEIKAPEAAGHLSVIWIK